MRFIAEQILSLFICLVLDLNVVDRQSGKPIENVDVRIFQEVYNRSSRKSVKKSIGSESTNQNGAIQFKAPKGQNAQYSFDLKKGTDVLIGGDHYLHTYRDNRNTYSEVYMMTDRSIYRPGQTLYFKGLLIEKDNSMGQRSKPSLGVHALSNLMMVEDIRAFSPFWF